MKTVGWAAAGVVVAGLAALAWAAKPATVKLRQEGIALELTFDRGAKIVLTSKPTTLDAGTYTVKAARLLKPDAQKRTWELRVDGDFSTLQTLTVEGEQEKIVDAGEPILYDCFVWVTGKTSGAVKDVLLRVTAYGKYSEIYYPGAYLGGRRPPPPAWKVTAEDGRVFGQGQFGSPGPGGRVEVVFKAPKGYTGKVKIELAPTMGPFEWKYRNQEHNLKPT